MAKRAAAPKSIKTVAGLARELGVERRTVQLWVKAGCPRNANGSFDPEAVEKWAKARRGAKDAADGLPADEIGLALEKRRADVKWKRARAEIAELQRDEMRGALVPADQVDVFIDRLGAFHQQELLRQVETWNEQVEGMSKRERGEFLEAAVRRMLAAWQDEGMKMALKSRRAAK